MRKRILFSAIPAVVGCFFLAPTTPPAAAVPGECQVTSFAGFSGGYCDQAPLADGSFNHCETAGAFGLSHQRCYQACLDVAGRPFVTDLDPTTPCVTALTAVPDAALPEAPVAVPNPVLVEAPVAVPNPALSEAPVAVPNPALPEAPVAVPNPTLPEAPVAVPEPTLAPAPMPNPVPTATNSPSPL